MAEVGNDLTNRCLASLCAANVAGIAAVLPADFLGGLLCSTGVEVQDGNACAFFGEAFGSGPTDSPQRGSARHDRDLVFQKHV